MILSSSQQSDKCIDKSDDEKEASTIDYLFQKGQIIHNH